jgi:hypothetical protein
MARQTLAAFVAATTALIASGAALASSPVVHSALGGEIIGYDVDQNGTEGILTEYVALNGGENDVAVETFDQTTGKIIKIVKEIKNTKDDFVTLGVTGTSVGLVMEEIEKGLYVGKRKYLTLNPLDGNQFTGVWTPSLKKDELISEVSENQGAATTAVLGFHNTDTNFGSFVFGTNVDQNTFGKLIDIKNTVFGENDSPVMAMDDSTGEAVVAASNGCRMCGTELVKVDLTSGKQKEFAGLGFGFVNGIAVDSADGIACTATEIDFSLEFYDLASGKGTIVTLPGAESQLQSGQDVQFDPVNKLFLVGQEYTSTGASGSSILVFDIHGNFVESINNLSLPASPTLIAINPNTRTGFVWVTPAGTSLQGFSY